MYELKCFGCQRWFTAEEPVAFCPECELNKPNNEVSVDELTNITGDMDTTSEDITNIDEVEDDPVEEEEEEFVDDGSSMDDL